jgi:predicted XRE-type DNA-binding protein
MRKQKFVTDVPVHEGSGNVYADLGYADPEDMKLKAQLVTRIAVAIRERGLTQEEAGGILGLTQPKISNLLKGQFRGISEHRLLRCLMCLGRDIEIVVKSAVRHRAGRLTVHFARDPARTQRHEVPPKQVRRRQEQAL